MPQKIVLIDDTPDHLELLAEFVGELRPSASICRVCDGRDLPHHLEAGPVDLVMVDLMMPSISGFDLVRQVRQEGRWPDLPIIAVSGLRKAEQQRELQQAGFSDYLFKPYEVDELVRVLDRHLPA
jgi:two-component system, sensor histidine kinase SagS